MVTESKDGDRLVDCTANRVPTTVAHTYQGAGDEFL